MIPSSRLLLQPDWVNRYAAELFYATVDFVGKGFAIVTGGHYRIAERNLNFNSSQAQ